MRVRQTGVFIQQLRKDAGLTQEALAKKLGVTRAAVSKWERGAGYPDITLLIPLSEILHISVEELLAGKASADDSKSALSQSIEEITSAYESRNLRILAMAMAAVIVSLLYYAFMHNWNVLVITLPVVLIYIALTLYLPKRKLISFLLITFSILFSFVSVNHIQAQNEQAASAASWIGTWQNQALSISFSEDESTGQYTYVIDDQTNSFSDCAHIHGTLQKLNAKSAVVNCDVLNDPIIIKDGQNLFMIIEKDHNYSSIEMNFISRTPIYIEDDSKTCR